MYYNSAITAQTQAWILPKHQINAAYGRGYATNIFFDRVKGSNTWGLSYTYNISRHFYITAEALTSYASFKWTGFQLTKDYFLTDQKDRLPVYKTANFYDNSPITFRATDKLALIGDKGFFKNNYAAVHLGYMKSLSRNLFRVGVGVGNSWNEGRDIRVTSAGNNTGFSYLAEIKNTQPDWMLTMNYDYFFNQNISAGFRLVFLSGFDFEGGIATSQLSVGYAFVGRKIKKQPKV